MNDCKDHWWKAMGVVSSAYFADVNRGYMRYEISECKMCAETKIELLDPEIKNYLDKSMLDKD